VNLQLEVVKLLLHHRAPLVSLGARHLQRDESLLDMLLKLDDTAPNVTVASFDAVAKSCLHLLKFIEDETEVGVDGWLIRPCLARVVVEVRLHVL
jgi:hypothetical protein